QEVKTMEKQMSNTQWKTFRAETELTIVTCISERLEAEERGEERKMVELIEEEISRANAEAETYRQSLQGIEDHSREDAVEQVRMWRSLVKIFMLKLKIAQIAANRDEQLLSTETPIGDRSPIASRPISGRQIASRAVQRP
uniref:Uncharacterized protein n=1 Tax=Parascaris univalens TaxID=6257 RepID=A0A914ZCR4_PARUN